MNVRIMCLSLTLVAAPMATLAAEGLVVPAADALWPQWQARITVQSASTTPLAATRLFDAGTAQRGVQGGALFGDYYFATPSFGSFRASGGLMTGAVGGTPLASAAAGSRLGLALSNGSAWTGSLGAETPGTVPYLGLGFTGTAGSSALAISADLGLVAERPAGLGRAIFGNQGMDGAARELRLSPLLQFGVRYAF